MTTQQAAESGQLIVFGGNNTSGAIEVATACNAKGGTGRSDFESETFVVDGRNLNDQGDISSTLQAKRQGYSLNYHPLVAIPINTQIATRGGKLGEGTGFGIGEPDDPAYTIQANHGHAIAWHNRQQSGEVGVQGDTVNSVTKQWGTGGNNVPFVGVRRLTPTECERLQGFPDGWTANQSDSARYRQLGNAVAVPVVEWIVRRIYDQTN